MFKSILCTLGLSFAAMTHGAEPIVDNEHATVWDTAVILASGDAHAVIAELK